MIFLNEALNENCSIDKLNKSKRLRTIQKAMCTNYQSEIVFYKCFDKLFSNEHYECFLELINVQTFIEELIYHLEKGSGIVYTALYSKNVTAEILKNNLKIKSRGLNRIIK